MNFLITINHLEKFGGAEKFVLNLVDSLLAQTHKVYLIALKVGQSYDAAICLGAIPFQNQQVDAIIINHNSTFESIKYLARKVPTFQISHGKFPYLEQPISNLSGYFAVSPEVKKYLFLRGGIESNIMWNPVSKPKMRSSIRDIDFLILCQGHKASNLLKEMIPDQYKCVYGNKHNDEIMDVESIMKRTKVVIGTGRAIMEGATYGCATFCMDSRHYDGLRIIGVVSKENWKTLSTTNFSGREVEDKIDESDLLPFLQYLVNQWKSVANHTEKLAILQHDSMHVTKQFVATLQAPRNKPKWYERFQVRDLRNAEEKAKWGSA